ncbi:hypothetical protein B0A48_05880 [Cryoendolithus antarcticus]|uniref:Uncharacterized protein n=1 Tax=Cryoendolithus antarcticus TaxID=1507870 RepID=A0A1V8TC93_9PEZI|nr:hypothetical protein B0A48_05880 [Cryoendolithus antarcticus]
MSNFVRGYNSSATENDIEWDAFQAGGKSHERCTTPEYEADKAARKAAKDARKEARKSGSSRVDSPYAGTKALHAGSFDAVDESPSRRPAGITPGRFDRSNKAENSATSDKSFAESFAASAKSTASIGSQISEKAKAVGGFVRRASLSLTRRFSSSSVNVAADGDAKVYKTPAEVAAHAEEQEKYRQTAPKHRPQNQKRWLCHRYSKDFNTLLENTEREPTDAAVERYFGALAQHRMWATDAVDREPLAMTAAERKQAERSFWPPLVADVDGNATPPPRTPSPPPAPQGVITSMSIGAARIMAKAGKAKIRESPMLSTIRTSMQPKKGALHPVTSLSPDFTDMNVPADMMTACGWEEGPNKGKGCSKLPERALTNGLCENCRRALYMKIAGRKKLRKRFDQTRPDRRSMSVDIAYKLPKSGLQDSACRMSRSGSLPAIRGQLPSGEPFWYDGERDSAFYDFYEELLALYGIELGECD